jgi:two-component system, cell cycle response regulator
MILVIADDLLFRSKISTAAKATGVVVRAATTVEAALERARADHPSLVLLDLDSARTEPFEVLRRFAEDPDLSRLQTLGFVSHVHADLVKRARMLGIGNVMARGAFAATLPEILAPHAEPGQAG